MSHRNFVDLIARLNDGEEGPFPKLPSSLADLRLLLGSVQHPAGRALIETRIAERTAHNRRHRAEWKAAHNG